VLLRKAHLVAEAGARLARTAAPAEHACAGREEVPRWLQGRVGAGYPLPRVGVRGQGLRAEVLRHVLSELRPELVGELLGGCVGEEEAVQSEDRPAKRVREC
jgi:hypothetical protein